MGPAIITDNDGVLWLSTVYENEQLARDQIEADVNAGIAAPLTLKVVPVRVIGFIRGDHHPRKRSREHAEFLAEERRCNAL